MTKRHCEMIFLTKEMTTATHNLHDYMAIHSIDWGCKLHSARRALLCAGLGGCDVLGIDPAGI